MAFQKYAYIIWDHPEFPSSYDLNAGSIHLIVREIHYLIYPTVFSAMVECPNGKFVKLQPNEFGYNDTQIEDPRP